MISKGFLSVVLTAGIAVFFTAAVSLADPLAFPGAEGWGAYALGGRGGDVYHVTNLNDDGAGSLRYGISTAGGTAGSPRTIVFDVSGTITLASKLNINKSYITIAGQTAPGDGVCLRDHYLAVNASHVIVRYVRSRLGDESLTQDDAVSIQSGFNIIMDHISASWSVDEVFSCSTSQPTLGNVTVQWCIISEALWHSIHDKGTHSYGALIRGCYDAKYTYHHNLFAHNYSRNPRPGNYDSTVSDGNPYWEDPCGLLFDFRNNVIYNWGGSRPGYDADLDSVCRYNYIGNYAKPGYNGTAGYLYSAACTYFKAYYAGNYFNGTYLADDWSKVYWDTSKGGWTQAQIDAYKQSVPFPAGPITTDTALDAYQKVLATAGDSFPFRDPVDTRVVNDVINGTGEIIDTQSQVGGWPTLNSATAPADTDQDGMPDAWEIANGLDPNDAADRNYYDLNSNYTNLEVYLYYLVESDINAPTPDPMTFATAPYALGPTSIAMVASTATDDAHDVEYYFTCTAGGGHDSGWQSGTSYTDTGLTSNTMYTYTVKARDTSTAHNETVESDPASATTGDDNTPPSPDPMTFATAPYVDGPTSIAMVASTATDVSGVEYYFACTAGGGHDSGWQSSTSYTDTGLSAGITYTYKVKARDLSSSYNQTAYSDEASAIIAEDTTPPSPDPMTWASAPNALSSTVITMTATTATDFSGVEYYFANNTDPNHDSGWQDSPTYTDTNLTPSTTYEYQVAARDKSIHANQTGWSGQAGATTLAAVTIAPPAAYWMFDETSGSVAHDVTGSAALEGTLQGTAPPAWTAGHFGNCLTFAAGGGRVYVPSSSAIDFADEDFSVSLWAIQPVSFSGQYEVLIKGTIGSGAFPGSGKRYELYRKDAQFRFAIDDNVTKSEIQAATTDFCTGDWVHIVAVRDTATNQIRLYANGVPKGTATDNTGSISQTEPMYIADGVFDSGSIDDVRIYPYALDQDQITELYNGAEVADYFCTSQITSDLDGNCQVDLYDYAILGAAWAATPPEADITDLAGFAADWLSCNRDPADQCW
jgi:hypothetical protein